MGTDINEVKKALRKETTRRRNSIDNASRLEKSQEIIQRLISLSDFSHAANIFSYVSYRSEVDTWQFLKLCLDRGKRVYVPRVLDKENMGFFQITSLDQLEQGGMDIWEPTAACPPYCHEKTSGQNMMIIPGLAFDDQGKRLGYGGGYYDRYLHTFGPCLKIGLAFECQIVPAVPCGRTDIKVDGIVTENAYIKMGG